MLEQNLGDARRRKRTLNVRQKGITVRRAREVRLARQKEGEKGEGWFDKPVTKKANRYPPEAPWLRDDVKLKVFRGIIINPGSGTCRRERRARGMYWGQGSGILTAEKWRCARGVGSA